MAHKQMSFFEPFLKNKAPPPTFFFQEAHSFNSKTSTMPTYNVSCKGCSQKHQGQGVQKVCPARTSSGTLCARKRSRPDKCVMFHLLTVFPNNTAEQEKYHLSNVLKKPQRVGIHQFVQHVEQLNAYVAQLPCWYCSPSYNAGMTLANNPFSEADLASYVLWMCLHQWQDQYSLQEKGMTPMDMHSLQASLKAIKRICTPEKTHAPSGEKASHKNEAGAKRSSNGATKQAHKEVCLRSLASCAKNMGACILCTLPKIAASMRKTGW
jgi:hypothetical protein